ncbi:hypothetical protein ABB07_07905 [Streptomyces incarnatus]|uniref:Uncharacterized protein n=1 Tax=Streptomyces incarnatus TaxID=665007 RepID=A0ABM5TGI7_9ACTN|nr:hypothetical protein ABB07_07905 [Streptomyces incarnatus]
MPRTLLLAPGARSSTAFAFGAGAGISRIGVVAEPERLRRTRIAVVGPVRRPGSGGYPEEMDHLIES